jgi:hypothetical protein
VSTAVPRGLPLLITAELPPDVLAWADAIRRTHYPPARNRLRAHVTLFHGLPPSAADQVRRLLGEVAGGTEPPEARIAGLMDLGRGTAFAVECPGMVSLHEQLAESLHGLIQQKDAREPALHITFQNKVERTDAQALQAGLRARFEPRRFRFRGFGLYGWDGELWKFERLFSFRGSP